MRKTEDNLSYGRTAITLIANAEHCFWRYPKQWLGCQLPRCSIQRGGAFKGDEILKNFCDVQFQLAMPNYNLLNPFADDQPKPLVPGCSIRMNFEAIVDIHDIVLNLMDEYDDLSLPEVAALENLVVAYEVCPDIPLEERWRDGKFIIYIDPTKRVSEKKLDFYKQLMHIRVKRDLRSSASKIMPGNKRKKRKP